MIIASKIDERTKAQLDNLLKVGTYRDYSDIIVTAIQNLSLLHDEMGDGRSLIFGTSRSRSDLSEKVEGAPRQPETAAGVQTSVTLAPALRRLWIFHRASLESASPPKAFPPSPADHFLPGQDVPVDRWVFGQFSKLLPAKASARALANLEIRDDLNLSFDETASVIASNAAILGEYLIERDDRLRLQRDDASALGFPSNAENAEKSRLRYANQFVGSLNKSGVLSGLMIDLKLVNLSESRDQRLQLTKAGWDFAILRNPILDESDTTGAKFTQTERSFLIEHIHHSVPIEAFAYCAILRAILAGADTPDSLDDALKPYIPSRREPPIARTFVTTQRSGAISRMADLGLVIRVRDGVRVSYAATDSGKAFADNLSPLVSERFN